MTSEFFKTSTTWGVDVRVIMGAELQQLYGSRAQLVDVRQATDEEETQYLRGATPRNILCPTGRRGPGSEGPGCGFLRRARAGSLFLDSTGPGGLAKPSLGVADLAVADRVDVRLFRGLSGRLIASRVERTDPDPVLNIRAQVDTKTPVSSVTLIGVTVATGPNTRYRDAAANLVSAADFHGSLQLPPALPTRVRAQGVATQASPGTLDVTRTSGPRGEVEIAQ